MSARWLADLVVIVHFVFVAFAVGGVALVFWRTKVAFAHLPVLAWAAYVELSGRICPLTPLENALRRNAGSDGYSESFIDHYLVPVIYPAGLTRDIQIAGGSALLLLNLGAYLWLWRRRTRRHRSRR